MSDTEPIADEATYGHPDSYYGHTTGTYGDLRVGIEVPPRGVLVSIFASEASRMNLALENMDVRPSVEAVGVRAMVEERVESELQATDPQEHEVDYHQVPTSILEPSMGSEVLRQAQVLTSAQEPQMDSEVLQRARVLVDARSGAEVVLEKVEAV